MYDSDSEESDDFASADNASNSVDTNTSTSTANTSSTGSQLNESYLGTFFTHKEMCFYKMIKKFFSNCNKNDIITMIDIIEKKSPTSLRILDWFVTKYSKKKINGMNATKQNDAFDVRISYKAQLKAYKKHYFDPFRRRQNTQRFKYYFDDELYLYTTLGQLNFFKWAISNNIIKFVENNIASITNAMNASNKNEKNNKKMVDGDKKYTGQEQGQGQGQIQTQYSADKNNKSQHFILSFN